MEFLFSDDQSRAISGVNDEENAAGIPAVALPHAAVEGLAAEVPAGDADVPFFHGAPGEGDCGDGVGCEVGALWRGMVSKFG